MKSKYKYQQSMQQLAYAYVGIIVVLIVSMIIQ